MYNNIEIYSAGELLVPMEKFYVIQLFLCHCVIVCLDATGALE